MKKLKILTSILLALVLCLSFCLPSVVNAQTATPDTHTLTINNAKAGHTYVAYQVFTGDLVETDGTTILSNVVWGNAIDSTTEANMKTYFNNKYSAVAGKIFADAADIAEYLGEHIENNSDEIIEFANKVWQSIRNKSVPSKEATTIGNTATIEGLQSGYYLVVDKQLKDDATPVEGEIFSNIIIRITDDEAIAPKTDLPTLDKIVGKVNEDGSYDFTPEDGLNNPDAEGTTVSRHNTANIGDTIAFKLTGKFPNLLEYDETYVYRIEDTLGTGFTGPNNIKVKIICDEGKEIEVPEGDYVYTSSTGDAFKIDFSEKIYEKYYAYDKETAENTTFTAAGIESGKSFAGKTIEVTYTAVLNENAKTGTNANKNTAYLVYSSNPRTDEKGKTVATETETYTFKVNIDKISKKYYEKYYDATAFPEDKWVKVNAEGKKYMYLVESDTDDATKVVAGLEGAIFELYRKDGDVLIGEYDPTNSDGLVELTGLSNGEYYLKETTAPEGYNKFAGKIEFTISARYAADDSKLLLGKSNVTVDHSSDLKNVADADIYHIDDVMDDIYVSITNSSGAVLPSTGGIGTIIFTVVGILIMASVVVIGIKSNKKEN